MLPLKAIVIVSALVVAPEALADAPGAPDEVRASASQIIDAEGFLRIATSINTLRAGAAELILERSDGAELRAAADATLAATEREAQALAALAQSADAASPPPIIPDHQAKLDELRELDGGRFEDLATETLIGALEQLQGLYRAAALSSDAAVVEYAEQAAATLPARQAEAEALRESGGR